MKLEDIGFLEVVEERAKRIRPGKISYCEWFITSGCNFNCPYCNRLEPRHIEDPTIEEVKGIVRVLSDMECKYVHLTGGEPTTRGDLLDIIHILRVME
jgi:molybdenum cofactor biosynthesis enzyme MoaA